MYEKTFHRCRIHNCRQRHYSPHGLKGELTEHVSCLTLQMRTLYVDLSLVIICCRRTCGNHTHKHSLQSLSPYLLLALSLFLSHPLSPFPPLSTLSLSLSVPLSFLCHSALITKQQRKTKPWEGETLPCDSLS